MAYIMTADDWQKHKGLTVLTLQQTPHIVSKDIAYLESKIARQISTTDLGGQEMKTAANSLL